MAISAIRRAPLAALLMLGAIAIPAQAGWFDSDSKTAAKTDAGAKAEAKGAVQPAITLDDSILQAQMLRLAGSYPEAIKHLSQLMMVASDDPRVISEYGKTLAAMGRPSDAVNFLTRAQQLQPSDWTVYSALGVAYDQIGDQKNAQINYEQALKIKPEEPSVLSNYALSRMLAKDPENARKLVTRAESAAGSGDIMIKRNIAMIRSLAPETPVAQTQIARTATPAPVSTSAAPQAPVASVSNIQPQVASNPAPQSENRVVMQKVPVDPLAGPVQAAAKPTIAPVVATNAPRPLQAKPVTSPAAAPVTVVASAKPVEVKPVPVKAAETAPQATAKVATTVKPVEAKPVPVKPVETAPVATAKVAVPAPVKAVAVKSVPVKFSQAVPLTASKVTFAPLKIAEPAVTTIAKTTAPVPVKAGEPAPVATAKATTPVPVKAAEVKPVPAKSAEPAAVATAKVTLPAPVKAAEVKPAASALAPVKTAEAKPVPVKAVVKTAKDAIPGLRLSANAY